MAQYYSPEQMQVLYEMIDLFTLDEVIEMAGPGSVERLVGKVRDAAASTAGDFYDAKDLIGRWDFWVRYEAGLASGRRDRAEAVTMMIYDAGAAIGSPADWSAPQPTTIANAYLEGRV